MEMAYYFKCLFHVGQMQYWMIFLNMNEKYTAFKPK